MFRSCSGTGRLNYRTTDPENRMVLNPVARQNHSSPGEEYLNTTHWLRAAIYVHDIAKDAKLSGLRALWLSSFISTLDVALLCCMHLCVRKSGSYQH